MSNFYTASSTIWDKMKNNYNFIQILYKPKQLLHFQYLFHFQCLLKFDVVTENSIEKIKIRDFNLRKES